MLGIHLVHEVFCGIGYHVMAINAEDRTFTDSDSTYVARSFQRLLERISVYPLSGICLDTETSYVLDACPSAQCQPSSV